MPRPARPKIYHIMHVDRLASVIADGCLWCDAEIARRTPPGTTIGMNRIKKRRLTELKLTCHPDLYVGQCVPFYFCPRSVMLFLIHRANDPDLTYRGGQGPIIHLEADLQNVVGWATRANLRWAFTLSNAGTRFFEDRNDLSNLDQIDWDAVEARDWRQCKDGKQAEFLIEHRFPWSLVERIGVQSTGIYAQVDASLPAAGHRPAVAVQPMWYY